MNFHEDIVLDFVLAPYHPIKLSNSSYQQDDGDYFYKLFDFQKNLIIEDMD